MSALQRQKEGWAESPSSPNATCSWILMPRVPRLDLAKANHDPQLSNRAAQDRLMSQASIVSAGAL